MKKLPVFLAIIAVALVAYSMTRWVSGKKTVNASKNIKTKTQKLDDFTKIEVDGVFEVDVTYSSDESVLVEAPDNVLEHVELKVQSGTLTVQFNKNTHLNSTGAIKVHIKTARLNDFAISGASSIKLNNSLKDDHFTIEGSGAASFDGNVDVKKADITLDGAATVMLSGNTTTASFILSGASQVNDYDFNVEDLTVNLSGASSVKISTSKTLSGDLSGASSLNYKGDPITKRLSTSGASSADQH